MADGKPWTFEQLGGERRKVTLSGWGAPFGRPRKGPVVRTPLRVRTERTFYPGSNNSTRHIFGEQFPDWELHGRFRDRAGGKGFARAKMTELLAFVDGRQPIRILWGDILGGFGFISEFDPAIESEGEVEWTMRVEIDLPFWGRPNVRVDDQTPPREYATDILSAMEDLQGALEDAALPQDIFEALDTLVSAPLAAIAEIQSFADEVESMKDSTFGQLNRLTSSLTTLGQSIHSLRETFAAIPADAANASENADDSIALFQAQATGEERCVKINQTGARMGRAAQRVRLGRIKTTHIAPAGETWESMSIRHYGDPGRAAELAQANNAGAGSAPAAGVEYLIAA